MTEAICKWIPMIENEWPGGWMEVEPLIRCKDCMWFSIGQLKSDGTPDMRCKPTWCSLHRTYAKAEFFCSWGNEG